jgi:hypothetical protein
MAASGPLGQGRIVAVPALGGVVFAEVDGLAVEDDVGAAGSLVVTVFRLKGLGAGHRAGSEKGFAVK